MVLDKLSLKHCAICNKRGDYVKKGHLAEFKDIKTLQKFKEAFKQEIEQNNTDLQLGNIYCKKRIFDLPKFNLNNHSITEINNQSQILSTGNESSLFDISCENENSYNTNLVSDHEVSEIITTNIIQNEVKKNNNHNNAEHSNYLIVDHPKTYSSHAYCFICKAASGT